MSRLRSASSSLSVNLVIKAPPVAIEGIIEMKKLRKSESSPLQLDLPFETVSLQEIDAATKFEHFQDVDLMELIYDLKPSKWPEDKALLSAAQRELERRRAKEI